MGTEYNSYTGIATTDAGSSEDSTSGLEINAFNAFETQGDIMSTVKSHQGSPVTGRQVQPSDTIEVHGFRMTVAMAASPQFGFLMRDAGGNFIPTATGQQGAKQAAPVEGTVGLASGGTAEEALAVGFKADAATEEIMDTLAQGVQADTQIAAIDSLLRNDGELDVRVAERIASQLGVEPHQARETVAAAVTGIEDATYRHLEDLGVYSRDAFTAYLHSNPQVRAEWVMAARDLVLNKSTAGMERLAEDFTLQADLHDPQEVAQALNEAGIKWHRGGGGRFILDLTASGHGQMAFKQAVQLGFIKLRRNG